MFLMSLYYLMSTLKGDYCILQRHPDKGIGRDATIDRHELAFVKFLKANYGNSEYSVVICRGGFKGFKLFWRGIIEKDRFIRMSGSISPYLMTLSPMNTWHELKEVKKEDEQKRF